MSYRDFERELAAFKMTVGGGGRGHGGFGSGGGGSNTRALQRWEVSVLEERFGDGEGNVNISAFFDELLRGGSSNARLDATLLGATAAAGGGARDRADKSSLPGLEGMFERLRAFMRPPADVDLTGGAAPGDSTAALWLRFKYFDEDGKEFFDAKDLKVR